MDGVPFRRDIDSPNMKSFIRILLRQFNYFFFFLHVRCYIFLTSFLVRVRKVHIDVNTPSRK